MVRSDRASGGVEGPGGAPFLTSVQLWCGELERKRRKDGGDGVQVGGKLGGEKRVKEH